MCVPLFLLKNILEERALAMAERSFVLLPVEEESIRTVTYLLYGGIVLHLVVVPLLQFALAMAYFKYGHAWSRVLRREAGVFPWESPEEPVEEGDGENECTRL